MDDRLVRSLQLSVKKREAFLASQGRSFRSFLELQPASVQPSISHANSLLQKLEDSAKLSDDAVPKVRVALNQIRPLNDDIRLKRKLTQSLREKAGKSTKKAESTQSKLDIAQARKQSSPEIIRLRDEVSRAASQKEADVKASRQREVQLLGEEIEYKKKVFLAVLGALEEFTAAKGTAAAALIPIGEELEGAGAEIPFFEDSMLEQFHRQLEILENEPLDD
jgi:hypothetical protein